MPGDPFYQSPEWRAIRRQALKRDRYRCVMCRADLAKLRASRVDHILPRRQFPALALSLANLRSLCPTCDNRQAQEKFERMQGPRFVRVDSTGQTAAWKAESEDKRR